MGGAAALAPRARRALAVAGLCLAFVPVTTDGFARAWTRRAPIAAGPAGEPRSYQCVSSLRYEAAPEQPYRLMWSSAGADLVRWQIHASRAGAEVRRTVFRQGDVLRVLDAHGEASRVLAGAEREQVRAQIALRRALFLWPDGCAWTGTGLERTADLGDLGSLRARFASAESPRPTEIGDFDADGRARDVYRALTWREIEGRWWPASAELWHAGARVWTETLESATTRARFLASLFVPPDALPQHSETQRVQTIRLDPTAGRRFALACAAPKPGAPAPTWEQAILEVEDLQAEWSARVRALGLELETGKATIELDAALRPRACVLRLRTVPEKLPEGFETTPERKGAAIGVPGLELVTADPLSRLSKAAPAGTDVRAAYVRFDLAAPAIGQALIVLPFPPAAGR